MSNVIKLHEPIGQINIRASTPETIQMLESHSTLSFPKAPNTSSKTKTQALFWLGPDEWLLLTDYATSYKTTTALKACIAGYSGAITNVSDNRVCFTLSGADSHMILQQGTAINIKALNPGHVVQTLFAKTQIIIHCMKPYHYQLLVRTSFKAYTEAFLERAAQNLALSL
ncbi:MAG: sarcosine oxidase subunit gamma family protein [Legionellaceae bacterium]|nr:sarcosine oxidase subunit gamma family protein [Legionellaceae bacterium]